MPRLPRQAPGGIGYHVLNRGGGRMTLFDKPADYDAFEKTVADTLESCPMRIPGYCITPNHWPLILHPEPDGDLASFMQKLTRWGLIQFKSVSLPSSGVYHARQTELDQTSY